MGTRRKPSQEGAAVSTTRVAALPALLPPPPRPAWGVEAVPVLAASRQPRQPASPSLMIHATSMSSTMVRTVEILSGSNTRLE
jgi:hypothetical protein